MTVSSATAADERAPGIATSIPCTICPWFAILLVRLVHGDFAMRMCWALLLLLPFAACGRDEGDYTTTAASSDTVTTSPDTADARFDPKAAQATAPPSKIALIQQDVQVTLVDHEIHMTGSLSPAQVTFNVTNAGTREHSFEVEGEGIEKALDRSLQPGQSAKLIVDLHAGTYKVYCPVADHEERGMTRTLVVQ